MLIYVYGPMYSIIMISTVNLAGMVIGQDRGVV